MCVCVCVAWVCVCVCVCAMCVCMCMSDLHWAHSEVRGSRRGRASALWGRADLCGRDGGGGEVPSAGGAAHAAGRKTGTRQPDCAAQGRIR